MFTCLSVDMYQGLHVCMHPCVCVLLMYSPSVAVPPAVDACSGDSIVSMSKDLPAALFRHVFIMLIQRKKGGGAIARQTERMGNLSPPLFILTTSSVLSIPLYFPFFSSLHPLHLPLSYLPPYFFDNPSEHCLHNYTQQWFPSLQEKCALCMENIS